MLLGSGVDQLDGDADFVSRLADASFQERLDVEFGEIIDRQ